MQSAQLDQNAALAVTSALLRPNPPWANGKLATSQEMWLGGLTTSGSELAATMRHGALRMSCSKRSAPPQNIIGSCCSAVEEVNPSTLEIRDN